VSDKSTYKELEQKIKELEKGIEDKARLEHRLKLLSLAIEQSPEGIAVSDMNGNLEYLNDTFATIHGYLPEKLLGKNLSIFHTPIQMQAVEAANRQIKETGSFKGEIWHVKRDGTEFPTLMNNSLIKDEAGKPIGLIGILRDISDMKNAEEELRQSEDKYRAIIENMEEGYYEVDLRGNFTFVNDSMCEIRGVPRDKIIGMNNRSFMSPETAKEVYKVFNRVYRSGETVKSFSYEGLGPGNSKQYVESSVSLMRDSSGNPIGFRGVVRDVTERKRAEEEKLKLEFQLRQAQKMEAVGTLAGGIAHDFNNILSIIVGNTELVIDDIPEWNPARRNLMEVKKASLRARDMVKRILAFSRQSREEKKPVPVTPLIIESLKLLRSSIPTTIEIRSNLSADPDTVLADSSLISQVLMNLCSNAAYAMREKGGALEVHLDNIRVHETSGSAYQDLIPGNYVRLTVRDTGDGIAPEVMERIFDPYFTTKRVDEGSGMGLAVVHGIVTHHDGLIIAHSEQGKGSIFEVLIPVIDMAAETEVKKPDNLPRGTERILFVDDEEQIVKASKQMLERLGYKVEASISSPEALEIFRNNPNTYDLVITDYSMPQMAGRELAKELMAIRPDIPIILCTGYRDQIDENSAKEIGIKAFAMKPVIMSEIAHTIREVLD